MAAAIFKWTVIAMVAFATFLLILMAVGTTIKGVREIKERKK